MNIFFNSSETQIFLGFKPYKNPLISDTSHIQNSYQVHHKFSFNHLMAEEKDKSVTDLATKFMQAALDLGDVDEVVCYQSNNVEDNEEISEEISLVGKVIIEGKMGLKTMEKNIFLTWDFLPEEDLKVFELDHNIMEFCFKDKDTQKKVFDTRPWSINGYLVILHFYNSEVIYQDLNWVFNVSGFN